VTEKEYAHGTMGTVIRGSVYRVHYDDCYTNEYTALRAERTIGEEKYDLFEQNCEHTTTWSKTGLYSSDQFDSCLASFWKMAFAIFLRAGIISVIWVIQNCYQPDLGIPQSVANAAAGPATLMALFFAAYSIYRGWGKIKPYAKPAWRQPGADWTEACRKDCAIAFFACCCCRQPICSRFACCVCMFACLCCSLCDATCTFWAKKLRACRIPCCGRPFASVLGLIVASVFREMLAVTLPLGVIVHDDYFVWYISERRGVYLSADPASNRAGIMILHVLLSYIVIWPIAVLLARCVRAPFESGYCYPSRRREGHKHDMDYMDRPWIVHDEIVQVNPAAGKYGRYHTSVPIQDSTYSAVVMM